MNIAILGYGVEGESVYHFYHAKYPDATFTAYDNNSSPKNPLPEGVNFVGNVSDFTGINADIAIKTPAIAPWNVRVSGEVTTMTREFLKACPAPVIGVTGSKGKGTTASLTQAILQAAGLKTWLVGNIGLGAFDVLDQIQTSDVVIYELSSFQLWDVDVSPNIAVVLGIEPEHLDVHKDFNDYVNAKGNIARYQHPSDIVIYKKDNTHALYIASISRARSIGYQDEKTAHVANNSFYYGEQELCSVEALQLPGKYNQDNACAAIDAAWRWVQDGDVIAKGLQSFKGLPHRLQKIATVEGVEYYDNSIATTPGSTIAVLQSFEQPKVLILGGSYKGSTYDELAAEIAKSVMRNVILIGSEASKIEKALQQVGYTAYENLGVDTTMREIVHMAEGTAKPGDIVLLSPACASFDMFTSYADRGEQFIQAVRAL